MEFQEEGTSSFTGWLRGILKSHSALSSQIFGREEPF